ncbi:hypothetical protein FJZ31_28860 [Candidatus Poribacteria bacterium]|nr:hypothetical protein [Candidatus Poribacteria bacterium]
MGKVVTLTLHPLTLLPKYVHKGSGYTRDTNSGLIPRGKEEPEIMESLDRIERGQRDNREILSSHVVT